MTPAFRALGLPDVRRESVETALLDQGVRWDDAAHVAATGSLAATIRDTGVPSVAIAQLIDLAVWSGMQPGLRMDISDFPRPSLLREGNGGEYQRALNEWRSVLSGRRMNVSVRSDVTLRRFLRSSASDRTVAEVLLGTQRQFRQTIQVLIAAGMHPSDFVSDDATAAVAVEAWADLEQNVPALVAIRDDLWMPESDYRDQRNATAREVIGRYRSVLDHVFAPAGRPLSVVHHGFYFFTPPQWAFFQLLRALPEVDQYFIVHDDGDNPVFESWRRFFVERWNMPRPEPVQLDSEATLAAGLLRDALRGAGPSGRTLDSSVRIQRHESPAEFARDLTERVTKAAQAGGQAPILFAADAPDVERRLERLSPIGASERVNLAHLPVGQFLLAIHDAIRPTTSGLDLVLTAEQVLDVASSGFFETRDPRRDPVANIGAIRRAMPFFRGCRSLAEWADRAAALHRSVVEEVNAISERDPTAPDVDRIATSLQNPLRSVPWCDLSTSEAEAVLNLVTRIDQLVNQLAEYESSTIKDYLDFIREHLQRGMRDLDQAQQREINAKLRGFVGGADEELDIQGLVDVVHLLLGREAEFDDTGEDVTDLANVRELRALDALGFARSDRDICVANLAEGIFPSRRRIIGWPFRPLDLFDADGLPPVSIEIMRTWTETSALSDLYLFWLALDGVDPDCSLTVSWIVESGGQEWNPSPLLALIATAEHWSEPVRTLAGGIDIESTRDNLLNSPAADAPMPSDAEGDEADVRAGLSAVDTRATASAFVCPRRFALQWATGPSAAFQSEHTQIMLYGNVGGALVRLGLATTDQADRICDEVWQHVSEGERLTSLNLRRIQPSGVSADPVWLHTLGGSKTRTDPTSKAYRAALGSLPPPSIDDVAPEGTAYLPKRPDTNRDICTSCPVRPRCSAAHRPDGG